MIKASDSSISVRDAVLEFISKLIFTPPPFETDPTDLIRSVLSRIKVKNDSDSLNIYFTNLFRIAGFQYVKEP